MLLNATEAKVRLTELLGEGLAAELADPMWKVSVEGGQYACSSASACAALGRVWLRSCRQQMLVSA
jgi:hypothetical protein